MRCKQQRGRNSCYPQLIASRSDTWWKYFWVGKMVRLIWACCSPLRTVIILWTKLRRMMCARGLRSSALLCGKSASKNTVFLPLMSVCFRAHSDPLSLSQTARKETLPFYLQTSLGVSSVSQQDAASTQIKFHTVLGQRGLLCVDMKVVCGSRVFVVVDGCSE